MIMASILPVRPFIQVNQFVQVGGSSNMQKNY